MHKRLAAPLPDPPAPGLRQALGTQGLLILLSLTLPHVALTLGAQLPGLLAPWLQSGLGLSRAQVGAFSSARFMGASLMFMSSGLLVQRWGPARSILAGLGAYGIANIAIAGAPDFTGAMLLFFATGFGFALIHPSTTVGIVTEFDPAYRATIMGLKETGVPMGGALVALSAPYIATHWHWRWAFVVLGSVIIVCAVLSWRLLRTYSRGRQPPPVSGGNWLAILRLAGRGDVFATAVLQFFFMAGQFAMLTYLLLYLVESVRLPVASAVPVVAIAQVGAWFARLGWGMISDRCFGGRQRPVMALLCLVNALSFALLASFGTGTPLPFFYLVSFLLGFGPHGWFGPLLLIRSGLGGAEQSAQLTAAGMVVGVWGAILGPPLLGYLLDVTGSYRLAWSLVAAMFVLCLAAVFRIPEQRLPVQGR